MTMDDYKLTIEKVTNGYIVSHPDEFDDGVKVEFRDVIEEPEEEWGELAAGLHLLYFVMDYFGLIGSKHDAKRLRVEIVEKESDGDIRDMDR